jgi:nitrite reductase (NO-forming)
VKWTGLAGVSAAALGRTGGMAWAQAGAGPAGDVPAPADIVRDPADVPAPLGRRTPRTIDVRLETVELEGVLDPATGARFRYWTFDGTVPGPMLRGRVGDSFDVTLVNRADSHMAHNVDFHAATGPGGGGEATLARPGETRRVRFKALNPGLYIYHCAVAPVALHVANGMYGLILIEPEGGLSPADREFYVMQGEIYTAERFGSAGLLHPSTEKMLDERPEYFVFNGAVGALTTRKPLRARVGETVRIFFGVGGPNYASSFHVIGEIFDRAYTWGGLPADPLRNVGVIGVPAGGAAIVEMKLKVPGRYLLVDHALSRMQRGLVGWLEVEGRGDPEVFSPGS